MTLANDFRVFAELARRSLKQTFRRPQFLAPILVFPSMFLAVNTGGAGRAVDIPGFPDVNGFLDFELAGAMMQSTLLAGVSAGVALAMDIEAGFIDRMISAPIRRSAVVTGRLGATFALGVLAGCWFLAAGLIFGAEIVGGVPGALVALLLTGLAAMSFGGLGSALALKSGRASTVQSIFPIVFVILFFSSAFFPKDLMLEPGSTVAAWNPITLIVDGIRDPIVSGISAGELAKGFAGVAIVTAMSAALSAWALRSRLRAA